MKPKVECRVKAFPPMILGLLSLVSALLAFPDVVCTWDGTGYNCSGTGTTVTIDGGGGSGYPGGGDYTNALGSCTNCSQIAPSELDSLATRLSESYRDLTSLISDCGSRCGAVKNSIEAQNAEIATFRTFEASVAGRLAATNYMVTVDNDQSEAMRYAYDNVGSTLPGSRQAAAQGAGNAVYYYANNMVKPQNQDNLDRIAWIEGDLQNLQLAADSLGPISSTLHEGAVACQGSGSGSSTNDANGGAVTGNWCTYEQGEALKDLLGELKEFANKQLRKLDAISNYTAQTVHAIRTGLFTEYNAIPAASALGDDWRQVYLDGAETRWGYQPTNILARIELLLYGMSGVGTNSTVFTEDGEAGSTEVMDDVETQARVKNQIEAVDTDADDTDVKSLGSSLVSLFQSLDLQTSEHSSADIAISSVSYQVGSYQGYVEAIGLPQNVGWINTLRSTCSNVAGAGYMVLAAVMVFMYWRWFAGMAVKMSKWAVELITSLFAS